MNPLVSIAIAIFGPVGGVWTGYVLTRRRVESRSRQVQEDHMTKMSAEMAMWGREIGSLRIVTENIRDRLAGLEGLINARRFWNDPNP